MTATVQRANCTMTGKFSHGGSVLHYQCLCTASPSLVKEMAHKLSVLLLPAYLRLFLL